MFLPPHDKSSEPNRANRKNPAIRRKTLHLVKCGATQLLTGVIIISFLVIGAAIMTGIAALIGQIVVVCGHVQHPWANGDAVRDWPLPLNVGAAIFVATAGIGFLLFLAWGTIRTICTAWQAIKREWDKT